ncbi:MAG TPA: IPT/TIG domain-containing protein [Thermoanaerobaculia bacterium]|nr:IPT/TIG domain-containing protein [Thermoanaerobaculia bacterium]
MRINGVLVPLLLIPTLAAGATVNVAIGPGLTFTPSSVVVAPGDTVQWNFAFGFAHTTTSDRTTGAEVWDSGIRTSGSFSHTFTTAGDWPYYCSLHSSPAFLGGTFMNGVVHVAAPPTLTNVNPSTGSTAGGTAVTLTGTNFVAGCTVDFGGAAATSVNVSNATAITATTPGHAAGPVTVTVNCTAGSGSLLNGFTFNSAPSITSVTPSSALPGTTVTITGSGFQNGATVTFRGAASPTVTFVNATTLQALVPNLTPGAATVAVTNPDALSGSFAGFSVTSLAIPLLSRAMLLLLIAALGIAAVRILR